MRKQYRKAIEVQTSSVDKKLVVAKDNGFKDFYDLLFDADDLAKNLSKSDSAKEFDS